MSKVLTLIIIVMSYNLHAQFGFQRASDIDVVKNSISQKYAWAGGLDYAQYSNIDLNFDGIQDLFIFDRTTNKTLTFIQNGSVGNIDFEYAPEFETAFPDMQNWCLLVDYNCDDKADIFTSTIGGIKVYKNVSSGGVLKFTLENSILETFYDNDYVFMYASLVDISGIVDIDFDGDIDILAFGVNGTTLEYQRNMSMETYGVCDSLIFETGNMCWGLFEESPSANTILLSQPCDNQVDNPNHVTPTENQDRHAGSTVLPLDIDGNGVMDVILGDISYNSLTLLTNGGTVPNTNSSMTSQDNGFPSNTTSVDISIFPAAYFVDINNDNKRDLVVAPNSTIGSENTKSNWLYLNTNTDNSPTFNYQQNDFLQDGMIEIGSGSYPVFFDHNADGLMDLLVSNQGKYETSSGNQKSQIAYYQNTGSSTTPEYTFVTDDYQNLSQLGIGTQLNFYPTFADLDNDGDKDMILGEYTGYQYYFSNTGGAGNSAIFNSYTILKAFDDTPIIDGIYPIPQLVDMDRDGDFDLVIGKRNGKLNYYENIGTSSSYDFELKSTEFGNVNVTQTGFVEGRAVPIFIDIDNEYHLLIGAQDGYLHYYDELEGNLEGSFHLKDASVDNINIGKQAAPAIYNLNNGNYYKMILGNKRGGVGLFNTAPIDQIGLNENIPFDINLYPNPANNLIKIDVVSELNSTFFIRILDLSGRQIYMDEMNQNNNTINLSEFENGIYLISVIIDEQIITKKIVVNHE